MQEQEQNEKTASPVEAVVMWFKMLIPRFIVALNSCPLCNSDAPELDNCPLCGGYHSSRGDEYPPPEDLKEKWLMEMYSVICMQRNIKKAVRESRKRRLNT